MNDQRLVNDLAERVVCGQSNGATVSPEEVCRTHNRPDLLAAVQLHILQLEDDIAAGDAALREVYGSSPPSGHPPVPPSGTLLATTDIENLHFLAQGGMGEVFGGESGRGGQIAVKVAKSGCDMHGFEEEQMIMALLNHPNIVSWYGAGRTNEGRPFYAMRRVNGRVFTEEIAHYHKCRGDEGNLKLRRLLEQFRGACGALAHAHGKGVVHRDLKPANIMVGEFGEVQVMDWGLAKRGRTAAHVESGRSTDAPHAPAETLDTPDNRRVETGPGQAMGTEAYMSPEQASGDVNSIDCRSDVFGLGACLYHLLTNRAPYEDLSFDHVRRGDFRPVWSEKRGVPRALAKICHKAMAKNPAERYESPAALAEQIERWLVGRAVDCHRSLPVRVQLWGYRHLEKIVIPAVVLIFCLVGAVAVVLREQRKTAFAWEEEKKATVRVVAHEQTVYVALDQMTGIATQELLASRVELNDQGKAYLRTVLVLYEKFTADRGSTVPARRDRARAIMRVGLIQQLLGEYPSARTAFEDALKIRTELSASDGAAETMSDLAETHTALGKLFRLVSENDKVDFHCDIALQIQQAVVKTAPSEPVFRRNLATMWMNRGVLLASRDPRAAESAYSKAVEIGRMLVASRSAVTEDRRGLANALDYLAVLLKNNGKEPESKKIFLEALAIREGIAAEISVSQPYHLEELASGYNNYGTWLMQLQKWIDAEEVFHKAIRVYDDLTGRFPSAPVYRSGLVRGQLNLFLIQVKIPRFDEAEKTRKRLMESLDRLIGQFPTIPEYRKMRAVGLDHSAVLFANTNRQAMAEQAHDQALACRKELHDSDRENPDYRFGLAVTYNNRANSFNAQRRGHDAAAQFRLAADHFRQLADRSPTEAKFRNSLEKSVLNLGKVLRNSGRKSEADKVELELLELQAKWAETFSDVIDYQLAKCRLLVHRGDLNAAKDEAELLASRSKATKIDLFNSACIMALCARACQDRGDSGMEFADRAMEILKQVVSKGYNYGDHLQEDPDLDPLRFRDDFRQLLKKLNVAPLEQLPMPIPEDAKP